MFRSLYEAKCDIRVGFLELIWLHIDMFNYNNISAQIENFRETDNIWGLMKSGKRFVCGKFLLNFNDILSFSRPRLWLRTTVMSE